MKKHYSGGEEIESNENELLALTKILPFKIPEHLLFTLVDMAAIGQSNVCGGQRVYDMELRESFANLADVIYEQAYEHGGADMVWKNPQDGTYHHPTFPENEGRAWETMQSHREECLEMDVIGMAADILAEQEVLCPAEYDSLYEYHEHRLLDVLETTGIRGLIKFLIGGAGLQENS